MILSVLICTIPERTDKLQSLLLSLYEQRKNKPVEVIYLGDFKYMSVGEKRNHLLKLSCGDYVVFIDDDDHISSDYISTILKGIEDHNGIDCLAIDGWQTKDGDQRGEFSFKKEWGKNFNFRETEKNENRGKMIHARFPNHICVWKRETALRVKFPNKNLAEDHEWAEKQSELDYNYVSLEGKIYHYDFNSQLTQTRRHD